MRPKSVILAEQLYLLAILLLLVLAGIVWRDNLRTLGVVLTFGVDAFAIGLSLLLLLLTTRRGSRIALWLLTIVTALGVGGFLWQVARGVLALGLTGVVSTVQTALTLVAVVLLFRPPARAWFARPVATA